MGSAASSSVPAVTLRALDFRQPAGADTLPGGLSSLLLLDYGPGKLLPPHPRRVQPHVAPCLEPLCPRPPTHAQCSLRWSSEELLPLVQTKAMEGGVARGPRPGQSRN